MQNNSSYLSKYIPNSITILSLCCGLTSIKFSLSQDWKISIYLIIFAAIFDFFDGWFASILIYFWTLTSLNSLGWSVVLFFAACAALRLARFTADIYLTNKPIDSTVYFTGIPSPAAAGLTLLPLFIYFEFDLSIIKNSYLNFFNLAIIGFLMISKIPTISLKSINFSKKIAPWIVLLIVLICIGLISNLWLTLIILAFTYIISILYTVINSR